MKTLRNFALAALLAAASLAQANTWTMPNEAGGQIVLTNRRCPVANSAPMLEAYAYARNGARQAACWTVFDHLIQISWEGGQHSTHQLMDFTPSAGNTPRPAKTPANKSLHF